MLCIGGQCYIKNAWVLKLNGSARFVIPPPPQLPVKQVLKDSKTLYCFANCNPMVTNICYFGRRTY